ncbi:ski-like protein [Arapaima gigas]
MDSPQTSHRLTHKELTMLNGSARRMAKTQVTKAPLKKRLMAEMNLKRQGSKENSEAPRIKKEHVEEDDEQEERQEYICDGSKKWGWALDLSPGLRHTLAQFTLSSQSSLGGPAAFSAREGQDETLLVSQQPLPLPPSGPLLAPCDSSMELTHALLEGEAISCFVVGGEKRLCLPQVLNSLLRDFSLQQINAVCDELYIYCSRCRSDQLHVLKVLGILPFSAPSCGLITLTDAQRLCNTLLRSSRVSPSPSPPLSSLKEDGSSFQVEHWCLGKGQGLFVGTLYSEPNAPCIQCTQCLLFFSPPCFVMHSHHLPDRRTCHWGFDCARWSCYLQLGRKYQGTSEEAPYKKLLEEMKKKFSQQQKKPVENVSSFYFVSNYVERLDSLSMCWAVLFVAFCHYAGLTSLLLYSSCILYKSDKDAATSISLGKADEVRTEVLNDVLKTHYNLERTPQELNLKLSSADSEATSQRASRCKHQSQPVTMETCQGKSTHTVPVNEDAILEEDGERMALEIVQLYHKQQEVLTATLQKHKQLEMELEALRWGWGHGHCELQKEPETVHIGNSREELKVPQKELKTIKSNYTQRCTCVPTAQSLPEMQYAAQLSELRQRLDRAEEDREDLQEALRQEREAREKLELVIAQLRQQLSKWDPVTAEAEPGGVLSQS